MINKKTVKVAGFVGALCASAALVATAATGTGAYFTDSHDGNLAGTSGHLQLSTTNTKINFTGLNPGQDKDQQIPYTPTGNSTTNEDVWLVFDTTTAAYGQFTGAKHVNYGGYTGGGLGGYGHFKVVSDQGYSFESYNLQVASQPAAAPSTPTATAAARPRRPDRTTAPQSAPECGVPGAIKLGNNLAPGQAAAATVTFGLTGKATTQDTGGQRAVQDRGDPGRHPAGREELLGRKNPSDAAVRVCEPARPHRRSHSRTSRGGESMRLLRWIAVGLLLALLAPAPVLARRLPGLHRAHRLDDADLPAGRRGDRQAVAPQRQARARSSPSGTRAAPDVVTHRVVEVTAGGIIHTKGDANATADVWDIRPTWSAARWPGTSPGWATCWSFSGSRPASARWPARCSRSACCGRCSSASNRQRGMAAPNQAAARRPGRHAASEVYHPLGSLLT